jgi:hypothetical protein
MADTFTANGKVRKIEQGGYPGAWAAILNAVIDQHDDMISGTEAINLGVTTSYALAALANGTDSESRAMVLAFTGTPASAVTVTVPASVTSKLYLVKNDSGQPITIKYAATDGVTVADDARAFVYADGTTVFTVATITSDAIGQTLNSLKETDEEDTAGVTILDHGYRPGDVRRYWSGSGSIATAWAAANAQAEEGGAPIRVPRISGGFTTAATLVTSANVPIDAEPDALITYTGSANEPALQIGEAGAVTTQLRYRLPLVRRQSQSDWSDEACIGIQLINLNRCMADFPEVTGFTIGVQWMGQSTACAGNIATYGLLLNNKIGRDHTNDDNTGVGYCNSNRHIGGYLTNDTGVNSTLSRIGDRINSVAATKYYNNDLSFDGAIYELNTAGSGAALPILVSYGVHNRWRNVRDELNDAVCLRTENNSYRNIVESNYPTGAVQIAGTYYDNFVLGLDKWPQKNFASSWQSVPIHQSANEYDGAASVYIAGMSLRGSTNGNHLRHATGFSLNDDYCGFGATRGVGIMIDTRRQKRFVLRRDTETSNGGRVLVLCYDAGVVQFTSGGAAHPYAGSDISTPLQYTSSFGGGYQTGGDDNNDIFVWVKDETKFIWIGVTGGTADARLRSISVQSLDGGGITAFQGFLDSGSLRFYNDQAHYATSAPATNIGVLYPIGYRITKANAAAGGLPGWICTTAGAGGTAVFKAEASVAA